jgi:hypothetical protein
MTPFRALGRADVALPLLVSIVAAMTTPLTLGSSGFDAVRIVSSEYDRTVLSLISMMVVRLPPLSCLAPLEPYVVDKGGRLASRWESGADLVATTELMEVREDSRDESLDVLELLAESSELDGDRFVSLGDMLALDGESVGGSARVPVLLC